MSPNTYSYCRAKIIEQLKITAEESMAKAADLERKKAIAKGNVINGLPFIDTVADGQWDKRSYRHGYDSLSGSAAILGNETKKVLFVGVRNKYCACCDYYERKNLPCKPHTCYKNFDRNASSTSMESDIIAEGFNTSVEMHGLIYKTLIADNDSSVYANIIHNKPYNDYNIEVDKIDCTNHLLRNICNKLRTIADTPNPLYRRNSEFVNLRKFIKSKIKKIRDEIDKAAIKRYNEDGNVSDKAANLSNDLFVIIKHVFGQ